MTQIIQKRAKPWTDRKCRERSLIENELFRIVFDIYTPRPHFIILFRTASSKKTLLDFEPNDFDNLIEIIKKFRFDFGLIEEKMIVSFHTGKWVSNHAEFHCHLCVSLACYLNILNTYGSNDYLSCVDRNKLPKPWKLVPRRQISLLDLYAVNVCNYLKVNFDTSNNYRLTEIKLAKASQPENSYLNEQNHQLKVRFNKFEPRIHFECKRSDESIVSLIMKMTRVAAKQGYFDKSNGGCHICADVGMKRDKAKVSGFIRVSGDVFYRLHPNPNIFIENFENNHKYYIDT